MPSIKDIVAGQSVGVGKRVIKAGADKLRGIINDRTGGGKMPTFKHFSMVNLTYPLDVAEDPRQGHYVIFTVREISRPAEVEFRTNPNTWLPEAVPSRGVPITKVEENAVFKGTYKEVDEFKDGKKTRINVRTANIEEARDSNRRYTIRPPSKRTSTLITLYMPPQVKNITGAEYEANEMSPLTTISSAVISSFFRENTNSDNAGLFAAAGKAIMKAAASAFESVGFGGASDAFQLGSGVAIGDRMEFVFKNPKKRAFPYQFDFYPKSEKEAQEVHEIIKTFRKHMLPSMAIEESRKGNPIFIVPNEFNIEYYYKSNENNFLNKIGNCYLTDCDVTYGGDRYTAFPTGSTKDGKPGASPTEIHLNLNFQEMDIITHEDVVDGY